MKRGDHHHLLIGTIASVELYIVSIMIGVMYTPEGLQRGALVLIVAVVV